jgi:hypothetical protein
MKTLVDISLLEFNKNRIIQYPTIQLNEKESMNIDYENVEKSYLINIHGMGYLIDQYLNNHNEIIHDINNKYVLLVCEFGSLEMLKYMVSRKASIYWPNDAPKKLVCKIGRLDLLKYMLSINDDFSIENNACIKTATEFGHFSIVKYLMKLYKNEQKKDKYTAVFEDETSWTIDIKSQVIIECMNMHENGHFTIVKHFAKYFTENLENYNILLV